MDEARGWAQCRHRPYQGDRRLGGTALGLYYRTEESMDGRNAFMERKKPDFSKFRR